LQQTGENTLTTQAEAHAIIIAAQLYLKRYKAANSALKEAKNILEEYMEDEHLDDVPGTVEGSGARVITRSGDRLLLLANMEDDLILWCAREGVLSGSIAEFDKLPQATRQTLDQHIGTGPGTSYVDIYSPPWGTARQQEKETARAARPAPAPLPAPVPAPAPPTPIRGAAVNATTAAELTCPEHNDAAPSNKHGGNYCPHKTSDGKWCKWTTASAVS
jgi:hypothetical protein